MTALTHRGGAPSELHEHRVETLGTLASLTGHGLPVSTLLRGERPDVVRLRAGDGSLFVGDAKATETPGNAETFGRLTRYAEFLTDWIEAGQRGVLALIVADAHAFGWLTVLRDLCVEPSGGTRIRGHVDPIESGTAVVWQSFVGRDA